MALAYASICFSKLDDSFVSLSTSYLSAEFVIKSSELLEFIWEIDSGSEETTGAETIGAGSDFLAGTGLSTGVATGEGVGFFSATAGAGVVATGLASAFLYLDRTYAITSLRFGASSYDFDF